MLDRTLSLPGKGNNGFIKFGQARPRALILSSVNEESSSKNTVRDLTGMSGAEVITWIPSILFGDIRCRREKLRTPPLCDLFAEQCGSVVLSIQTRGRDNRVARYGEIEQVRDLRSFSITSAR